MFMVRFVNLTNQKLFQEDAIKKEYSKLTYNRERKYNARNNQIYDNMSFDIYPDFLNI